MKVVYVSTRSDALGGSNVHIRDLAVGITKVGHDAVVLGGGNGRWADDVREHGIKYIPLSYLARPIRPHIDVLATAELRRSILAERPDIVSLHTAKAGTLGRIGLLGTRLPIIYTAHGWTFTEGIPRLEAMAYRNVERLVGPLADVIIDVCDYERNLAIRHGVGNEQQHAVVHNGMIDIGEEMLADPAKEPPTIVMVARFDVPKDHLTLLEALARLRHLPWMLSLVGDGPSRPHILAAISRLGLVDRVTLHGQRTDVAELLSRAQLATLITRWEGFPRSILEAMRAGLPTVASSVGGVSEAVVEGFAGYTVMPGHVEQLANRFERLITDPAHREHLGKNARDLYLRKFGFDRMFKATLSIYERLFQRRNLSTDRNPYRHA